MRDLYLVVADLDAENGITALLRRHQSLGTRAIHFDPEQDRLRYAGKDAGCCGDAVDLVRPFLRTHSHALVVFDKEGSGREGEDRSAIERDIEQRLSRQGWANRAAVIVMDPELEAWFWSTSPHVATELGFGSLQEMSGFLRAGGWIPHSATVMKPVRPKEAMEAALRENRRAYSARRFELLGQKVGNLDACTDPAFVKFLSRLREWFPRNQAQACAGQI